MAGLQVGCGVASDTGGVPMGVTIIDAHVARSRFRRPIVWCNCEGTIGTCFGWYCCWVQRTMDRVFVDIVWGLLPCQRKQLPLLPR